MPPNPNWTVKLTGRVEKALRRLSGEVQDALIALITEMQLVGPVPGEGWKNFGPLKKKPGIPDNAYHCHLKKGRPTYVTCWFVVDKREKIIEVFYVGTHENAPY